MAVQARALLKGSLDLKSRHQAKVASGAKGSRSTGKIHSIGTFNKYSDALKRADDWAKQTVGVCHLKALTPELAQHYLAERAALGIGQKQLDADRNALGFIVGKAKLEREFAIEKVTLVGRAYTTEQIQAVIAHQGERNAISTEIAWRAGIRAHELFTIQRANEAEVPPHRHWHAARFEGLSGQRYVVTGKGGLTREVLLPDVLAARLEARRLDRPIAIQDRGINYRAYYDIGGGNAWSKSFTDASLRTLGWSRGAHGLRHTYAQHRMDTLQSRSMGYYAARDVVSQELGHFRGDIVETYLR